MISRLGISSPPLSISVIAITFAFVLIVPFFWSASIAFQRFDSWSHQFDRRFGLIPKSIFIYRSA